MLNSDRILSTRVDTTTLSKYISVSLASAARASVRRYLASLFLDRPQNLDTAVSRQLSSTTRPSPDRSDGIQTSAGGSRKRRERYAEYRKQLFWVGEISFLVGPRLPRILEPSMIRQMVLRQDKRASMILH